MSGSSGQKPGAVYEGGGDRPRAGKEDDPCRDAEEAPEVVDCADLNDEPLPVEVTGVGASLVYAADEGAHCSDNDDGNDSLSDTMSNTLITSSDTSKKTKKTKQKKTSNTKAILNEMSNKVIQATGESSTQIEDELIQNITNPNPKTNSVSSEEDSEEDSEDSEDSE